MPEFGPPERLHQRLHVDGRTELREPVAHLGRASEAIAASVLEERQQDRRRDVNEVAEDVHILGLVDRGDLDSRDTGQTGGGCQRRGFSDSRDRVVIRNGEYVDAGLASPANEF